MAMPSAAAGPHTGLEHVETLLNPETVERDRGPAEVQLLSRWRHPADTRTTLGDHLATVVIAT